MHRTVGAALAVALAGCGRGGPLDLRCRLETGLERASDFLVATQSPDGAWRSRTYGALDDGPSLTPAVVKTLLLASTTVETRAATDRGAAYLRRLADGATIGDGRALVYPVYTAALSVIVLDRLLDEPMLAADCEAVHSARDHWAEHLRGFQLTEALGWTRGDLAYGGWGYSMRPPRKPPAGALPFEADLSSTLFAVGALRLAGSPPDDPSIQMARVFIERCQNFSEDPSAGDLSFDDGGFFFSASVAAQNKAGSAGLDRRGRGRFHSYGTATADGVRALLRCGHTPESPRVRSALSWLQRSFSTTANPGIFEPVLAPDRNAAFYYWCWSLSHAFRALGVTSFEQGGRTIEWAAPLAESILDRQRPDGSWINPHGFMKEDDPLIATALAAAALANCQANQSVQRPSRRIRSTIPTS